MELLWALALWFTWQAQTLPVELSVEGVVVAIQGTKTDLRMVEPDSVGDFVEVWMVRVDRWPRPRDQDFILIEYVHRDEPIPYDTLERSRWRFVIREAPAERRTECLSWSHGGRSFIRTALAKRLKLPDAKSLPCFLMEKKPLAVPRKPG